MYFFDKEVACGLIFEIQDWNQSGECLFNFVVFKIKRDNVLEVIFGIELGMQLDNSVFQKSPVSFSTPNHLPNLFYTLSYPFSQDVALLAFYANNGSDEEVETVLISDLGDVNEVGDSDEAVDLFFSLEWFV